MIRDGVGGGYVHVCCVCIGLIGTIKTLEFFSGITPLFDKHIYISRGLGGGCVCVYVGCVWVSSIISKPLGFSAE